MSPEEAHALSKRIGLLRKAGEELSREELKLDLAKRVEVLPSPPGSPQPSSPEPDISELETLVSRQDLDILRYRLKTWIHEVSAVIMTEFKGNDGLTSWITNLSDSTSIELTQYAPDELPFKSWPSSLKLPSQVRGVLKSGIALLDTALRSIVVDKRGPISDPLRLVIEDTVKEKYFESWPFRVVLFFLGLMIALLFGGTIYMEFKTKGVIAEAEELLGNIRTARADADKAKAELDDAFKSAIIRIETAADKEAQDQLKLLTASITSSKKTVDDATTNLKTQVDGATNDLKSQADAAKKSLKNQADEATNSLKSQADGATTNLKTQVDGATNDLKSQVDNTKKSLKSQVDEAANNFKSRADGATSDLKSQVDSAKKSLKSQADEAANTLKSQVDSATKALTNQDNSAKSDIEKQKAAILDTISNKIDTTIPAKSITQLLDNKLQAVVDEEKLKTPASEVEQFNNTINKYSQTVDNIFKRFQGKKKLSPLETIANLLGIAFWAMFIFTVLAIFVLVWFIVTLIMSKLATHRARANQGHH